MNAHEAWNWCWRDPACLAFPVAFLASLAAIARRVDAFEARPRRERGCLPLLRTCFTGGTFTGVVSFGLMVGGGSLWPNHLPVVTMLVLIAGVGIDYSAEASSGFIRTLLLTTLETYLKRMGLRVEPIPAEQSPRQRLPDEPPSPTA